MSAYAKEIKKIIVGIQAYDQQKLSELDAKLTHIIQNGSEAEIFESVHEVEKFLFQELLNYDMDGKVKSA